MDFTTWIEKCEKEQSEFEGQSIHLSILKLYFYEWFTSLPSVDQNTFFNRWSNNHLEDCTISNLFYHYYYNNEWPKEVINGLTPLHFPQT